MRQIALRQRWCQFRGDEPNAASTLGAEELSERGCEDRRGRDQDKCPAQHNLDRGHALLVPAPDAAPEILAFHGCSPLHELRLPRWLMEGNQHGRSTACLDQGTQQTRVTFTHEQVRSPCDATSRGPEGARDPC